MNNASLELGDYLAVLRRRKLYLIIPTVVVFLIALAVAFGLPPSYESTATILIEQQDIPQDLVRSTVTSYATERIQTISQQVMTRENLWNIVTKYDLFPEERATEDVGMIIADMRQNIAVSMVSADVVDPKSGREGKATIAFDLSFSNRDPLAAKEVVDELVSLYLQENIRIREQMAAETSGFLSEEASRLSKHILEMENQLAQYKEKNVGRLPSLMQMNLNLMDRTEREFDDSQREIASLQERKVYLESQLAQLEPNTGDSPEGRLRALQMQYLRSSAIYAPDHPDLVNMKREIETLKAQIGSTDNTDKLEGQILQVQAELALTRQRYSEDHPDVVRLKKSLASLNDELAAARKNAGSVVTNTFQPDNPAYVATKTQLEAIKISLKAAEEKRDGLKSKLTDYEDRLVQTPKVEQEGVALEREYDNAVQKYHEIKQKLLEAQVAEQLEKEKRGERFSLIDPPAVPGTPASPNRLGIMLLGAVLAMVAGLGFASAAEYLDQTVRGQRGVAMVLGSPPMATVPYIRVTEEDQGAKNRVLRWGLIVLGIIIVCYIIARILSMPGGGL